MTEYLNLLRREKLLFETDIKRHAGLLSELVRQGKFLVLGGAGTIGQAVVHEIFKRNPERLHVVDISENNLVELVRDLRSSQGYIDGEFQTFALDIGSPEYESYIAQAGSFDYVLNLSALKHVRSEKDPFTLMRMIKTNILNTEKTIEQSIAAGAKKYFSVSTDKAANPVNLMGASKRIMEMFLARHSSDISISSARFANVAFSDGSLLYGFDQRLKKQQPIAAPSDVRRYFVIPQEAGELCLMSCLLGKNGDIFFPKLSEALHLITFQEIAENYLASKGFEPLICESEEEARRSSADGVNDGKWPCVFAESNTTGEKPFEEFFTANEVVDEATFHSLGIVAADMTADNKLTDYFKTEINNMLVAGSWTKDEIVKLFRHMLPGFNYSDKGEYLDGKM